MTTKRYDHLSPSARRRRRTVQLVWTAVSAVPLLTLYYLARWTDRSTSAP